MAVENLKLRDHSLWFDPHICSQHQEVDDAIAHIYFQLHMLRIFKGKRITSPEDVHSHIKVLTLNAYMSAYNFPFVYRAISRRAPDYSVPINRYLQVQLSVHHVAGVMDDLEELGFIEIYKGYRSRADNYGYLTRYRATSLLTESMECFGVNTSLVSLIPTESIRLRDENKREIDYEDNEVTTAMRLNLERINGAIKKKNIHLGFTNKEHEDFLLSLMSNNLRNAFDLTSTSMHRVFNDCSWERGGRFYGGWWTNLPKAARAYIRIDGQITEEIDYSGIHVAILYAMEGLMPPADPYDLEEEGFPRDDQKVAFLILVNSESLDSALGAIRNEGIRWPRRILSRLKDRHAAISKYFYSGKGSYLQSLDSRMAESVMLRMIEWGGIALPVHDSFIVSKGRDGDLESAMKLAFAELFPSVEAKFKRKETFLQILQKQEQLSIGGNEDEDGFMTDDPGNLLGQDQDGNGTQ